MSEMVEKVAAALCVADGDDPERVRAISALRAYSGHDTPEWPAYVERARAAIEAMRDPSVQMLNAAWDEARIVAKEAGGAVGREEVLHVVSRYYEVMIEAASK